MGHWTQRVEVVHAVGQPRDVPCRFAERDVLKSIFVPVHIGDKDRIEVVCHPIKNGLGFQVDGEGIRHEACGTVDVVQIERLRPRVDQSVFKREFFGGNEGIDAVEVGLHGRFEFRNCGVGLNAFHGPLGGLAHAQGSQVLVVLNHVGAQQGGKLPAPCPAQQVHLP